MSNLNFEELQDIFSRVTFMIKGLDPDSTGQNIQKLVRRAYAEDSQPFNGIRDDTTYYWLALRDDFTNELVEEKGVYEETFDGLGNILTQILKFTRSQNRVLEVAFIFYGNSAFDSAQEARLKLLNEEMYTFLKTYEIHLNRDIKAVSFTYEDIQNRWWKRADFTASFNLSIETIEYVDIIKGVPLNVNEITMDTIQIEEG